jgi:hypothetical protein
MYHYFAANREKNRKFSVFPCIDLVYLLAGLVTPPPSFVTRCLYKCITLLFVSTPKKQRRSQIGKKIEKSLVFISTIFISSVNMRSDVQKFLFKKVCLLCIQKFSG